MKTILVCIAALFLAITVNAQPDIEWETIIPVPADPYQTPLSVEICHNGDILLAYATSSADGSQLRLHRFDMDGNEIETISWGNDIANAICTPTFDGNYFVAGTFTGGHDAFDVKFQPGNPNPIWVRPNFNFAGAVYPRDLHQTARGNFLLHSMGSMFLNRLDRFGLNPETIEYAYEPGGHVAHAEDIEQLNDGSYLTAGWYTNDMNWAVYYVWFLEDGTQLDYDAHVTAADYRSYATEQLQDGTLITVGDTYIEGGFNDPTDYGLYVMRTTQEGDILWAQTVGNWQDDHIRRGHDVAIESYYGDEYSAFVVGENTPVDSPTQHAYITEFTTTSNQSWELFPGDGVLTSIKRTIDGGFICLGMTPENEPWLIKLEPGIGVPQLELLAHLKDRYDFTPQGGQVSFNVLVRNGLATPMNYTIRLDAIMPDGDPMLIDQVTRTFQPGEPVRLQSCSVQVPGGAPAGEYALELTLRSGDVPRGRSIMTFTKTGATDGPAELSGTLLGDQPEPIIADAALPGEYALTAVYPNPFNAATTIHVTLPEMAELKVTVYNITGQQVATVANSTYNAGEHRLTFDASTLASGLYFVRATVPGELNAVRKVMLVR